MRRSSFAGSTACLGFCSLHVRRNQTGLTSLSNERSLAMKKIFLALVLIALTVSACDNKLPPTKAHGAAETLISGAAAAIGR
ncbi:hypothetical protein EN805_17650 [bacterium M00.F.Ca.ET.162.01.1.1]|nr:hypothetical protein EN848_20900 [bacterium M00.F.Ca.ET.205.01.1.1]TGZ42107.1 hypothetical protein EN805_17650 [bacterium M00.F.Ca.ET.162.01.1.1]